MLVIPFSVLVSQWVSQTRKILYLYSIILESIVMDSVVLSFVFDRKGITKKNPKKEALIQIKVYDKKTRKRKYISTGEYILKNQYSPVGPGGLSIIRHPNANAIKARIDTIFFKIQSYVYSDKCETWEDIDN